MGLVHLQGGCRHLSHFAVSHRPPDQGLRVVLHPFGVFGVPTVAVPIVSTKHQALSSTQHAARTTYTHQQS